MPMVINWQDIITTVGGQGVFLVAAAWLIRTVLTNRLTRDAEAFKTRLKAESDIEIERLRSSLQITAVEHQVRFSKLHERRAEVIAELYERLVDVFWAGQNFILTGASPAEQGLRDEYRNTMERIREFAIFVDTHRIYLPEGICALLDLYVDNVRRNVINVGVFGAIDFSNETTHKQRVDALMNAYQAFENKIPATRRALEHEFRTILGDPSEKHPTEITVKE